MERPSHKRPRLIQASAYDIVVKAGQIFDPEQGMAYLIRTGYFCVEVEIATTHGIITLKLGTIEEEELLCEEELLSTHLESGYKLRYRAEIDSVILGLTRDMLPRKEEEWKLFFLKSVRAGFRQRSNLYQLVVTLFHNKVDPDVATQPTMERELAYLRRELRSARETATATRKHHAIELDSLRKQLNEAVALKEQLLKNLKEASRLDRERQDELRAQSDATLSVVNLALQCNGLPPMNQMALLQLLSGPSSHPEPFRIPSRATSPQFDGPVSASKTLIPTGQGVPPPPKQLSTIIEDELIPPETHRWGHRLPK